MTRQRKCWCGSPLAPQFKRLVCAASWAHDPTATGIRDKITKLYVAGPMTGYPKCNYPEFNRVATLLRQTGYEVINPVDVEVAGGAAHYVDHLREDLRALLDCHGVATLDRWWESAGARNEVQVAGLLKMPVRSYSEWMSRWTKELQ